MPDPTLEELLLRKATSIGPQPQNALGQDLPLSEGQDYPSKVVEFLKGLGGFGEGHQGANALGQLLGVVAPVGAMGKADLSTDLASRMKRAAEMGFNKDVYHGVNPEGAAGPKPDIKEFDWYRVPMGDAGIHVDPNREVANVAAASKIQLDPSLDPFVAAEYEPYAHVMSLKARIQNPLALPDVGIWKGPRQWVNNMTEDKIDAARYASEPVLKALRDAAERKINAPSAHFPWPETFKSILKQHGYDSIVYPNYSEGRGGLSYMLLDPNQLRSKNALFDPARAKSGDLLASLLAGLGLGGAAASQEKK